MPPPAPALRRPETDCRQRDGRAAAALPAGYRLHRFGTVGSTNDEARHLAQQGAPDRTVVVAEMQTAGRGRHGREWQSPRGNLHASFVLRPPVPPDRAARIGFVAALAVHDTVAAFAAEPAAVACKWPNDVLVGDAKIAGILPESSTGADGALEWIVLGIGIDVASPATGTGRPTAALAAQGAGGGPDADTVLAVLAHALDARLAQWLDGSFERVRAAWLDRAWGIGRRIGVDLSGRRVEGRFLGLDRQGALLLDTGGSGPCIVHSGEVFAAGGR